MTTKTTTRHGVELTISDIFEIAVKCGASSSYPWLRDVVIHGSTGSVRKTLAVMGLGLDSDRSGVVQAVNDASGRCWGQINYTEDGHSCAVLSYLLASA